MQSSYVLPACAKIHLHSSHSLSSLSPLSSESLSLIVPVVAGPRIRVVIFPMDMGGAVIASIDIAVSICPARIHSLTVMPRRAIGTIVHVLVVRSRTGIVGGRAVAVVVGGAVCASGGAVAPGAVACGPSRGAIACRAAIACVVIGGSRGTVTRCSARRVIGVGVPVGGSGVIGVVGHDDCVVLSQLEDNIVLLFSGYRKRLSLIDTQNLI